MQDSDGTLTIGTEIDKSGIESDLDDVVDDVERKGKESGNAFSSAFGKGTSKIKSILSKTFEKVTGVASGLLRVIGNIVGVVLKIVGTLGIASILIGALTAGGMILAGAFKKVFEENEQVRANIQYIIFAINKALEPAVNVIADIIVKIINLIIKAIQYMAVFIKLLTGKNIFSGATMGAFADSMENANKSSKGIAKNLKEANKQLAGFDEMNVLNDTSSSGGGGGNSVGGGVSPNIDLSNIDDIEPPKWMKWILKNGETLKKIIEGIATALIMFKLGLSGWQGLGIFLILDGILNLIKDIKKYIDDPSWENFANILRDIGETILGFAFLIGITTPLGVILAIVGQLLIIIPGIISWVGALIDFFKDPSWENYVKTIQNGVKSMGLLGLAINWVIENILGGWDNVMSALEPVYNWIKEHIIDPIKTGFEGLFNGIKIVFMPIIDFFKNLFTGVYENIKISIENIKLIFSWLWEKIKGIFGPVGQFFKEKFDSAVKEIKKAFEPITTFFGNLWNKIKETLKGWGEKIGQIVGGALKSTINSILGTIDGILNTPIKTINSLIDKIRKVPGLGGLQRLNTIKIPRLAKGGIINMPGRGVAIGGESGPEGVIPLTDSQQMALLGEAIGKYITVNANITNTMNGRVISRELKKIDAENNFAFNK